MDNTSTTNQGEGEMEDQIKAIMDGALDAPKREAEAVKARRLARRLARAAMRSR